MPNPICFVAAGSGGHLIPCLTIAQRYRKNTNASLIFFTVDRPLENTIFKQYPWIEHVHKLNFAKWPRYKLWKYPFFLWSFISTCLVAFSVLKKNRPAKIVSLGGVVSIPICITGALLGIPIELYELNAIPGKAVRLLAILAQRIFICFEQAQHKLPASKCILAPYPVRFDSQSFNCARKSKKITTIFVLGGSQGSAFINSLITSWLLISPIAPSLKIIHQTGKDHITHLQDFYLKHAINAHVFDYDNNIDRYYQDADLIICRAGAGTLFESVFFQKPCITIPHEHCADNHQNANAHALAERYPHLITILSQSDLKNDPELLEYAVRIALHYDGQESGLSPSVNT